MKKRKSTLEQILTKSDDKDYVKHHDPLHLIENHVVVVIFLSLMFLMMSFVLISSAPLAENELSGMVVDDNIQNYEEINIIEPIKEEFSSIKEGIKYLFNPTRNYLTVLTYIFCIAMIGVMISQKPHEERK